MLFLVSFPDIICGPLLSRTCFYVDRGGKASILARIEMITELLDGEIDFLQELLQKALGGLKTQGRPRLWKVGPELTIGVCLILVGTPFWFGLNRKPAGKLAGGVASQRHPSCFWGQKLSRVGFGCDSIRFCLPHS